MLWLKHKAIHVNVDPKNIFKMVEIIRMKMCWLFLEKLSPESNFFSNRKIGFLMMTKTKILVLSCVL